MATKRDWVPVASLLISMAAAGFSGYQWYRSEVEAKDNAAIALSTKFLTDDATQKLRMQLLDDVRASVRGGDDKAEDGSIIYLYQLDYVAGLINKGQITQSYVAHLMQCDMVNWYDSIMVKKEWKRRSGFQTSTAQLAEFYKHNKDIDCR